MQTRQIEHEHKMLQQAIALEQNMGQACIKFEAQLATTLQQKSSQFQVNVMQ